MVVGLEGILGCGHGKWSEGTLGYKHGSWLAVVVGREETLGYVHRSLLVGKSARGCHREVRQGKRLG